MKKKGLPDNFPDADLQLCRRIEAAYADFLGRDVSRYAAAYNTLGSLYGEIVALHHRDEDASVDTLQVLGQRSPGALATMTHLSLSDREPAWRPPER